MALAADTTRRKMAAPWKIMSFRVVNGDILYAGALTGLALPGHASAGYILPYAPAANLCPIGFSMDPAVTGNSSGTPVPEASIDVGGGPILLTVTGIAGTVADVGKRVYATDDTTFVLTNTANYLDIGRIVRMHSSTQVWVEVDPMNVMLNKFADELEVTPSPSPTPTP